MLIPSPMLSIILQLYSYVCMYPTSKCLLKKAAVSLLEYAFLGQQTSWPCKLSLRHLYISSDFSKHRDLRMQGAERRKTEQGEQDKQQGRNWVGQLRQGRKWYWQQCHHQYSFLLSKLNSSFWDVCQARCMPARTSGSIQGTEVYCCTREQMHLSQG